MPLTNNVIIKLNEITTLVENKNLLNKHEIEEIKEIFQKILKNGDIYEIEEIESWLELEGTWKNKQVIIRLANIAHYVQTKFEHTSKFQIISNDHDECSCGN